MYETCHFEAKQVKCFVDNRQRELETVRSIIDLKQGMVREEMGNGNGNKCRFKHPITLEYQLWILPDPNVTRDDECNAGRTWKETDIMKAGALYERFVNFFKANHKKDLHCFLVSMKKMADCKDENPRCPASIKLMHEGKTINNMFFPPIEVPLPENLTVYKDKIEFTVPYDKQSSFNTDQSKETNLLMVSQFLIEPIIIALAIIKKCNFFLVLTKIYTRLRYNMLWLHTKKIGVLGFFLAPWVNAYWLPFEI